MSLLSQEKRTLSSDRNRRVLTIALLLFVPFLAACGAAEEAAEPEAAETPAPAPAPEPEMPAEEPEPEMPAEPEIVGNIILSGEDFSWGEAEGDNTPYTWTARVQNDTTSTLDITVRFQFLDESDTVLKTESATVTLAPASSRTINQGGTMSYDDALKVFGFLADYDYEVSE
jgi:hypothetical protein